MRAAPTGLTSSGRRRSPGSPVHLAPTPLLSLRRRLGAPLAPLALFVFVLFYPVTRGRRRGVYWPRGGGPAANRGGEAAAPAEREGSETWKVGAGRWGGTDGRRMRSGSGPAPREVGGGWRGLEGCAGVGAGVRLFDPPRLVSPQGVGRLSQLQSCGFPEVPSISGRVGKPFSSYFCPWPWLTRGSYRVSTCSEVSRSKGLSPLR